MEEIAETPYFRPSLTQYLANLRTTNIALLGKIQTIPPDVCAFIGRNISSAAQFLAGSTSKRIPYEIVHCITSALSDWTSDDVIVTTALSPDLEQGFYFRMVPKNFQIVVKAFLGVEFTSELAQISLPLVYRNRPLYNIPLYHELGHFIDVRNGVSESTLLAHPVPKQLAAMTVRHRMEHFADLFCACYLGAESTNFLIDFAGMQGASATHPATAARKQVVADFLGGSANPAVQMYQAALSKLNLPPLEVRFTAPHVRDDFDNACPCDVESDRHLHGLLSAAYAYLRNANLRTERPWKAMPQRSVEAVVNNLVEKSIRNYMVSTRWRETPP